MSITKDDQLLKRFERRYFRSKKDPMDFIFISAANTSNLFVQHMDTNEFEWISIVELSNNWEETIEEKSVRSKNI